MKTLFSFAIAAVLLVLAGCSQPGPVGVEQESANPSAASPDTTESSQPEAVGTDSLATPPQEESEKPAPTQELSEEEMDGIQWPVFRGDPQGTGFTEITLPTELKVLWEHKVDNGAFESTAAIVDDVVYIGDLDGTLFALDLQSGEVKWEYKAEIGFVASPAVQNGRVFVGNLDGIFFCIDTEGNELWRHESNGEIDAGANFYQDKVLYGSQDATLYCLDQETGDVVWQHQIDDQIRCSPTVVENRAFVAGCDGLLHIINLDDGTRADSVPIDSPTGVTPAVLGDVAYFGTEQAGFYAIDWKQAQVNWQFEDPDGATATRSNPAVTDGHVVFGARNRVVHSLTPENGEINWSFEARGPIDSSPVIAGDHVYIGASDKRMYVLKLSDGTLVSERELNGKIIGSPAVAGGCLIVATNRGVVYCLGK